MVKGRPLAPRTAELYRSYLRLHIVPELGDYQLRQLTPAIVRAWHGTLGRENGPGASTRAKVYRLLRAICNTAVEDELMVRNPVAIRGAGQEPESNRPMFSMSQVDVLVNATDERWRALFLLAGWAGLRFSELAALRRCDIDLDAGEVSVARAAVDVVGKPRTYDRPKSDAGRRTVAIPPHIVPALRAHLEHYGQPGRAGLVFVGPKGGVLKRSNFNKGVWQPARKAAGLPEGSRLHDLRGFSATMAARQGATVKELQARLGHSSFAAAMKYQRAERNRDAILAQAMSQAAAQHQAAERLEAEASKTG